MQQSRETSTAYISKLDQGIIRVEIKDHVHLEASNLEENYQAYLELLDGDDAPFLIIVNETATISSDGRSEYNERTRKEVRRADALVIKNPATMLLINSQVKFVKPIVPMQAFIEERSAINWLKSMSQKRA